MAFLHCHTEGCGWSQDDFWQLFVRRRWAKHWWQKIRFGYSPITRTWNKLIWLIKPRWIGLDKWIIHDMQEYTGVRVEFREVRKKLNDKKFSRSSEKSKYPADIYYYECQVYSWAWLWLELVAEWKNIKRMKWWTWKSWKKTRDNAVCPKCGLRNFDID